MSDTAFAHGRDSSADISGTIKGQVRSLLRAYQRQLRARPTTLQFNAMRNAAIAAARYDIALADLTLSGTTVAHYERVSRKAHAAMLATFPTPKPQPAPTLGDILGARQ